MAKGTANDSVQTQYEMFVERNTVAGNIPAVFNAVYDWVKCIYLTGHYTKIMDKQTKRDIFIHNKKL